MEKQWQSSFTDEQKAAMGKLFFTFKKAMRCKSAAIARQWLKKHALSETESDVGFISHPVHANKPEIFKKQLKAIGLLVPTLKGRMVFGKTALAFPLKDINCRVVDFYLINLENGEKTCLTHEGLYPVYPSHQTKQLYLTKNILDAATLLECKVRNTETAVLALREGKLTKEHLDAIGSLPDLKEIILIE